MLGAGPPRDGIIRTSPGQECSKDKGALPGARRISVYAARFRSATGCKTRVCFKPYHLILHLGEKRVSLCSAKRQSARSSMDRASDYGSEGWGFESLRARSGPPRCDPPVGVLHFYQALLRECFFHAHPLVVVPASRFPVRPETKVAQQLASLTGGATERARHGSFRTAPRQSSPCSPEMGHLGPLTRRSAGVRAIYRVGTRNNGLTCEHTHLARHRCAQNVDHLAHNALFSAYFAEVICTLGAIPSHVGDSP